ncbi:hypothetical protein V6R21_04385 [Limibacter armeniacum]|uniref:hypothetical protein n=1 Tax=Limibacter armeniacum TaxID=466084 RepID=UPI002FE5D3F1
MKYLLTCYFLLSAIFCKAQTTLVAGEYLVKAELFVTNGISNNSCTYGTYLDAYIVENNSTSYRTVTSTPPTLNYKYDIQIYKTDRDGYCVEDHLLDDFGGSVTLNETGNDYVDVILKRQYDSSNSEESIIKIKYICIKIPEGVLPVVVSQSN